MEFCDKCRDECPYYKMLHPGIMISIGTVRCMECGKEVPSPLAFDLNKDYKVWRWKWRRKLGHVCRDCASKYKRMEG